MVQCAESIRVWGAFRFGCAADGVGECGCVIRTDAVSGELDGELGELQVRGTE